MILVRQPFLEPADLAAVAAEIAGLAFQDGKRTAGGFARAVKANLQAAPHSARSVTDFVTARLVRDGVVQAFAWPHRVGGVLVSRTELGMGYGPHVDNALMGEGDNRLRTDLAFTLFMSDPNSYDGGELVVMAPDGERMLKLPAGGLVLYPANTIHRVETVSRGVRLAVVGWIQSAVRAQAQREILFDLANLRASMTDPAQLLVLDKTISNLLREWATV